MKIFRTFKEGGLVVVDGVNHTQTMAVAVEVLERVRISLQLRSYQSYHKAENPRYIRLSVFFPGVQNWFYRKLRNTRLAASNGFGFGKTLFQAAVLKEGN